MHHFIYPSKDTYITNRPDWNVKNFGIDEILQIGSQNKAARVLSQTTDYVYTDAIFNGQSVTLFTGTFSGSFGGTIVFANGIVSGSNLEFSASYFSGSIDGVSQTGSGVVDGALVNVYVTGSVIAPYVIGLFIGQLTGSDACFTGTGSGVDTRNQPQWTTTNAQYLDRSLLKFDIDSISASIADGAIVNPEFHLNLRICNEIDLPITYKIYALPVSQSWNMGDGYLSDGGSDTGVSWVYRDNNEGTEWYAPTNTSTRYSIDYIGNPSLSTASFGYGGGTWYTSSVCSQSFQYQSSDIDMDVTSIVNSWLNGGIPNEGFILVSSDELQSTGSGFALKFFSRDTNTIYSPYLDVMWNDVSQSGYITGSQSTGSVVIALMSSGITASVQSGSSLYIDGGISGSFSGSAILTFVAPVSFSGFTNGQGLTGNITGIPVFGNVDGIMSESESLVTGPCGKSFSASLATASFTNGIFSGSSFTAYYVDHVFENAQLTGSWTEAALLGATVTIPLPSVIEPYAYAYVKGIYVSGKAIGLYTTSGSTSASFAGQFVDGNLIGGTLNLQLSGSVVTSSYYYTSSVEMTSSAFTALNSTRPFTIVLQNVNPTYKAGDIARIGVFGRKQFPLKTFGKSTQQVQYMIPEYLPTSSFYALKDNETDEIVMNFDAFTTIGCEYPAGNYFILDTTSLPQERYYRVLIRVTDEQTTYTVDTGKTFKVTR